MNLIEAISATLAEGARVRWISNDVVNIYPTSRDLTNADVSAARTALTGAGWTEVESWVALEGKSWLSDGVASVSFRVK